MEYEKFKNLFLEWSIENIESTNNHSFPICPFAKTARLENQIQFINASTGSVYDSCLNFDDEKYKIGIAWLDNNLENIETVLNALRKNNYKLLYFLSTPTSGYFVKNFTNCIFIQNKEDILRKRKHLLNTDYYKNWPTEYFREIFQNV